MVDQAPSSKQPKQSKVIRVFGTVVTAIAGGGFLSWAVFDAESFVAGFVVGSVAIALMGLIFVMTWRPDLIQKFFKWDRDGRGES